MGEAVAVDDDDLLQEQRSFYRARAPDAYVSDPDGYAIAI